MRKTDITLLGEAYQKIFETQTSILQDIIQAVYNAEDLETAKAIFRDRVEKSNIPQATKRKMLLLDMPRINSLPEFQQYVTNSMLKKLKMGI